jgi:hypothetical protein
VPLRGNAPARLLLPPASRGGALQAVCYAFCSDAVLRFGRRCGFTYALRRCCMAAYAYAGVAVANVYVCGYDGRHAMETGWVTCGGDM